MIRPLPCSIVLTLVGVAAMPSGPVRAQTGGAQDAATDEARRAFARGEEAYDEGRLDEALRHFRRAYELAPRAGIRFNIAVCLDDLGRYREAVDEYEAVAGSEDLPEATRGRARERAEAAREHLGTLRVQGAPAGAEVLVDGEATCTLPCRVDLDPGEHDIEVRTDAGPAAATSTDVRQGEVQTVVLTPTGTSAGGRVRVADAGADPESAPASPPAERQQRAVDASTDTRGPSWLTWTGLALAVVGGGATVGLGIHTENLGDEYQAMPSSSLREKGLRARRATNAALGVAIVGALAIAVDLIFFAFDERRTERSTAAPGVYRF